MNAAATMLETAAVITIAEDVRLDLGHTDLVGTLVLDDDDLVLVAPSGSRQVLSTRLTSEPGDETGVAEGHFLIEEMGLQRKLPTALVAIGCFQEIARHKGWSPWGVDVVELALIEPAGGTTPDPNSESE